MVKLHVSRLWPKLYDSEAEAHKSGRPGAIRYFAVTNHDRFLGALGEIADQKRKRLSRESPRLEACVGRINEVCSNNGDYPDPRLEIEGVGHCKDAGYVDILQVPILEPRLLKDTAFERESRQPIVIFRCYEPWVRGNELKKYRNEAWTSSDNLQWVHTLSTESLETIYHAECSKDRGAPALIELPDLMVEAMDGSDLVLARKFLEKKELRKSLKTARDAVQDACLTWGEIYTELSSPGEKFEVPRKVFYLDRLKEKGIITVTDYAQADAYVCAGDAAIHGNPLDYSEINAILLLHWLGEFLGRTIGHHQTIKEVVNGTLFSDEYKMTLDERSFIARLAIFDQAQFLAREEAKHFSHQNWVYMSGRDDYNRDDVMQAAVKIVKTAEERGVRFNKSDEMFVTVVNFWNKVLEGRRPGDEFTAQDSIRAAKFASFLLDESREIDYSHLIKRPLDSANRNLHLVVGTKALRRRKNKDYDFADLEKELKSEVRVVREVSQEYFPTREGVSIKTLVEKLGCAVEVARDVLGKVKGDVVDAVLRITGYKKKEDQES
jgi:hypothetical protein